MSKRFLSLVLALMMVLPIMLASAVAEENPYAEHLTFTVLSLDGDESWKNLPLVKAAMEKFNFDFKIQQVAWDSWDATVRNLAYTQSLPEVIAWYNLNKDEYLEWVDEDVFKALPDDLSAYPNLERLVNTYTCFQEFRVDGKLYTFPKIKNSNPINNYSTYMFAYRRDWAKAMGYDYAPMQELTFDELMAYLRDLKAKDPGNMGDKLVPLDLDNGGNHWALLAEQWSQRIGSFDIVDGEYSWGATNPESLNAIKAIKTMYDEGLLAMDSYNDSNNAGRERFLAGRSGVLYGNLGASILQDTARKMEGNIPGFVEENLGLFAVRSAVDGKFHVSQTGEWWAAFGFASHCRDEVMERWLAVGNWLLEQEQVETYAYGVKDVDWTRDENGNVVLNWTNDDTAGEKAYIVTQRAFQKYFICEGLEVLLPGNPAYSSYIIEDLFTAYMKKLESDVVFAPNDFNLSSTKNENYLDFRSTVINNTKAVVIQAVISENPEQVWNDFLAENAERGAQVSKELTEEFLTK
ncbi:MAG: hypothetical protein Q4E72_05810 [bacterium]|nr:hypothetical protein [bacterium]